MHRSDLGLNQDLGTAVAGVMRTVQDGLCCRNPCHRCLDDSIDLSMDCANAVRQSALSFDVAALLDAVGQPSWSTIVSGREYLVLLVHEYGSDVTSQTGRPLSKCLSYREVGFRPVGPIIVS